MISRFAAARQAALRIAGALLLIAAVADAAWAQVNPAKPVLAEPQDLCVLLVKGMPTAGKPDPQLVELKIKSMQSSFFKDGRVDLCVGLIRLSGPRGVVKGMDALERAHTKDVLPAAHRVQVQQYLALQRHEDAAAALVRFAKAIESPRANGLTDEELVKAARWIGRLVAFFQHPGAKIDDGQALRKAAIDIESTLTKDLLAAYKAGTASLVAEWEDRKRPGRLEEEVLSDEARRQREAALNKVFDSKDKVINAREVLELKGKELEAWRMQNASVIEREIRPRAEMHQKLFIDYRQWDAARRSLGDFNGISEEREEEMCVILESQLVKIEKELQGLYSALWQVESIYRQAKSQVGRRSSELNEREFKLNLAKANAVGEFRQARAKRRPVKIDALETYVPFDLKAERDELLALWGYDAKAP